jgi:hypothetical protein
VPKSAYVTNTTFDAAIKLNTGEIEPAQLEVYV